MIVAVSNRLTRWLSRRKSSQRDRAEELLATCTRHGLRSTGNLSRSSPPVLVLARCGEALPYATCRFVTDSRLGRRGGRPPARPFGRKGFSHRRRQTLSQIRRERDRGAQICLRGDRRDRAHSPWGNRGGCQ